MPTTTRLSLRYPSTSDTADVPRDIGNLASDIDKAAIFAKGTFAARPTSTVGSPGIDGRYYFATDTSRLYLDTGTSWVEVASGSDSVTSTMIAANAVTDAKLGTALADNLGITNSGNTRRTYGSWSTERTTTSTSYVDVTGASLTFSVPTGGGLVYAALRAETKDSQGDTAESVRMYSTTYGMPLNGINPNNAAVTASIDSANKQLWQVSGTYLAGTWGTTFFAAAGNHTIKVQFGTGNATRTVFVRNVEMAIVTVAL